MIMHYCKVSLNYTCIWNEFDQILGEILLTNGVEDFKLQMYPIMSFLKMIANFVRLY